MRLQKNAQNRTSVGLFKCIYPENYQRYQPEILHAFLQIFGDHFLKISSNSEVVMLEPFVELTRNDPYAIKQCNWCTRVIKKMVLATMPNTKHPMELVRRRQMPLSSSKHLQNKNKRMDCTTLQIIHTDAHSK